MGYLICLSNLSILDVPDEGYFRTVLCTLNQISTFLFPFQSMLIISKCNIITPLVSSNSSYIDSLKQRCIQQLPIKRSLTSLLIITSLSLYLIFQQQKYPYKLLTTCFRMLFRTMFQICELFDELVEPHTSYRTIILRLRIDSSLPMTLLQCYFKTTDKAIFLKQNGTRRYIYTRFLVNQIFFCECTR